MLTAPASARGWLELAYERAYSEDNAGAARAAEAGLAAVVPSHPEDQETALSLWGVTASVEHIAGNDAAATAAAARRTSLLRSLGRTQQAELEEHLGSLLFREPRPEELPVLEAALATHAAAGAPPEVLADARLPLAVVRFEGGDETALGALEDCAQAYRAGRRTESEAGALLYLAHGYAKVGQPQRALQAADRLLGLPVNRAMQAAVWMVKAAGHNELDQPLEAESCAVEALALYSATGVRRGAVSAAALVANFASDAMDQDAAIAAWRIAVEQAERGEFEETWAVRLALGNQLLEAGEFLLAEELLENLAASLRGSGRTADEARALMSLGHSLRHQERDAEALAAWERAAAAFEETGLLGEASHACLSAGTLLAGEAEPERCLRFFAHAVELARAAAASDPAALPQALHAYGHALCEAGDADGLGILQEAIRLADDHAADWHRADFRDTRARSLWALGHGTEAVAAALEAADLFREAGDADGGGNAELFAAHVLAETGRADEAARLYRLIAAEHRESIAHYYAAQRGLAEVLAGLGLPVQAAESARLANEALARAQEEFMDEPDDDADGQDGDGPADGHDDGDAPSADGPGRAGGQAGGPAGA